MDPIIEKPVDLSSEEDLVLALTNLISIEEHLYFTYEKTQKEQYLDLLNEVREMRKSVMTDLIPKYEGETWCACKHLLSASMRLSEVATKALSKGDREEAKRYFDKAYQTMNMFWNVKASLNTGLTWELDQDSLKNVNCCEE